MANTAFRIHGAGCGLADLIYADIDFQSPRVRKYHSLRPGDGGLRMGKVSLLVDVLEFSGNSWDTVLADLTGQDKIPPPQFNVGGPGVVSMAALSQLLRPFRIPVTYYGLTGDDLTAGRIRHRLAQTPLDLSCYRQRPGRTPCTYVFSDPRAQNGHGDRFFIHDGSLSLPFDSTIVGEPFFQAVFNVYAGTAMIPALHKVTPELLERGRRRGAFNFVATVFDPYAERLNPEQAWTLGEGDAYPYIDLLITDAEEVLRLAGMGSPANPATTGGALETATIEKAVDKLLARGLTAAVVTNGANAIYYRSLGGIFGECRGTVSAHAGLAQKTLDRANNSGDTTGAGDNFLAGLLTDLIQQLLDDDFYPKTEVHVERELLQIIPLRLRRAVEFGAVAGALACLQVGGLHAEDKVGERLRQIKALLPKPLPSAQPW